MSDKTKGLTDKQEAFCQACAEHGDFRRAFAEVFDKKSRSFSILFYSDKIQKRLGELIKKPDVPKVKTALALPSSKKGLSREQSEFCEHLHRTGDAEHAYKLAYGKSSDGKAEKMARGMKVKCRLVELKVGNRVR